MTGKAKRSCGHPHNISCCFSFIRIVPYHNSIFFIFISRWHLCKWRAEREFFIWDFLRWNNGLSSWLSIEIMQIVLPLRRKKRFFVGKLLTSMTLLHSMGSQWKKPRRLFVRPLMNTSIDVKNLENLLENHFLWLEWSLENFCPLLYYNDSDNHGIKLKTDKIREPIK